MTAQQARSGSKSLVRGPGADPALTPGARPRRWLVVALIALALIVFYQGWRLLWFLTDDAYIAFRYVSNSQLGYGYVWNAPPFKPVDGYTSFLWIVLLDWAWSLLGVEPPESSNWLGFVFGAGTLLLTSVVILRIRLCDRLRSLRTGLLALVLLGVTTNFSFLMWASGGLGTSLFNFLFASWVISALCLRSGSATWVACVSASAGLLAITRPDGLLMLAASVLLIPIVLACGRERLRLVRVLAAAPLAVPVAYYLWHRSFYGDFLPNTYYAKHVAAWPQAGLRYLLSFVLEYGLWLWGLLGLGALLTTRGLPRLGHPRELLETLRADGQALSWVAVLVALGAHLGYYTLRVGGDHFEYRVYSHVVPLLFVSAVWMTDRLVARGWLSTRLALAPVLLIVALSWPMPWTIWARARKADTRAATMNLVVPLADSFPPGLRWYGRAFDELQHWLIVGHAVGKRHQEHRFFQLFRLARFPRQRQVDEAWEAEHRVLATKWVGVSGWILARAHVIDTLGLNDHVIAATPVQEGQERRMTHDRRPPPGYVECFRPNVDPPQVDLSGLGLAQLADFSAPPFRVRERAIPLTAEDIVRCETQWWTLVARER